MHIQTSNLPPMKMGFRSYSCNWGTHFCAIYETESERDEIMYGFLAEGLRARELLVCCPEEAQHDEAFEHVHLRCPEIPVPDASSLKVFKPSELYYPRGFFAPRDMITALENTWEENVSAGQRNVRATADMAWALAKIPGIEHLMAYESLLNTFIWGKAWISICMYDVNRFPGATIMKVLQTHPFAITSSGVFENPYFVQPEKWLAAHAPEFVIAA